jgi:hypothetical protein
MNRMLVTNNTRASVSLSRDMFTRNTYASLDGAPLSAGGVSPSEGFLVYECKPWHLQVQQQIDGSWHLVSTETFDTKAEGIAYAAKNGLSIDYVSHHKDHVFTRSITPELMKRINGPY